RQTCRHDPHLLFLLLASAHEVRRRALLLLSRFFDFLDQMEVVPAFVALRTDEGIRDFALDEISANIDDRAGIEAALRQGKAKSDSLHPLSTTSACDVCVHVL